MMVRPSTESGATFCDTLLQGEGLLGNRFSSCTDDILRAFKQVTTVG